MNIELKIIVKKHQMKILWAFSANLIKIVTNHPGAARPTSVF